MADGEGKKGHGRKVGEVRGNTLAKPVDVFVPCNRDLCEIEAATDRITGHRGTSQSRWRLEKEISRTRYRW